jgi:hypothetical protein
VKKPEPYWNREVRREKGAPGTLVRQRGLRGAKLGPASEGRRLTPEEAKRIEQALRDEGKIL